MMMDFKALIKKHNVQIDGILHIGGSFGQERELYKECGASEVIWIEAIPSVFEQLKKNLEPYPNQTAISACISNVDGEEVTFKISNNEAQSSSMLELGHHLVIHPEVKFIDEIKLTTTRIDTLFRLLERDTSKLNFLNIDLQGAELLALQGMGDMLKQFKFALLEVNKKETYKGCVLIDDLDYFMLQNGFERVETGQFVADTWTDALYKNVI